MKEMVDLIRWRLKTETPNSYSWAGLSLLTEAVETARDSQGSCDLRRIQALCDNISELQEAREIESLDLE